MTMTEQSEQLPRPAAELEQLAEYYGGHDTSNEMDSGEWVEPQPMATTSLRLPIEVIGQLKRQAQGPAFPLHDLCAADSGARCRDRTAVRASRNQRTA
jgi:hypothetical protein